MFRNNTLRPFLFLEIDKMSTFVNEQFGGVLGIDVGQEHMALCLKLHNDK